MRPASRANSRLGPVIPALLAVALATPGWAQGKQDKYQARLDKKLASPFLAKASWFTDFDKARAAAKKSGKVIFAYFTRSYVP